MLKLVYMYNAHDMLMVDIERASERESVCVWKRETGDWDRDNIIHFDGPETKQQR